MAAGSGGEFPGPPAARVHVEVQGVTLAGGVAGHPASRSQAVGEYYFFGDPVRMAGAYVGSYDREPYHAVVRAFLNRD